MVADKLDRFKTIIKEEEMALNSLTKENRSYDDIEGMKKNEAEYRKYVRIVFHRQSIFSDELHDKLNKIHWIIDQYGQPVEIILQLLKEMHRSAIGSNVTVKNDPSDLIVKVGRIRPHPMNFHEATRVTNKKLKINKADEDVVEKYKIDSLEQLFFLSPEYFAFLSLKRKIFEFEDAVETIEGAEYATKMKLLAAARQF